MRLSVLATAVLGASITTGKAQVSLISPDSHADTASVRGRVLAADGDVPLRNARVTLTHPGATAQTVLSDPDGRFVFMALRTGPYSLAAAKPGFVTMRVDAQRSPSNVSSVDGIDIRLPKSAAISGRIIDDRGDPVSGVTVTAETVAAPIAPVAAISQTNDLGEFRLGGLPAGTYVVNTNAGYALAALALNAAPGTLQSGATSLTITGRGDVGGKVFYPGVSSITSAQRIDVVAGEQRSNLDFTATMSVHFGAAPAVLPDRPGATGVIGGRVLRQDGQPLSQAYVVLRGVNGTDVDWRTNTDDEGQYRFLNLPPGDYTIQANRKGYVSFEFGQRRAFEDSQTIRLGSSQARERLDIGLPRLSALAGRIVDEFGDPVEGARVQVYGVRFMRGRRRLVEIGGTTQDTDDLGRFRIGGLQPGEYLVGAFVGRIDPLPVADVPGYALTYFPGTPSPLEAEPITVGLARDVVDVDFPLSRAKTARVAGSAWLSDGGPFQGVVLLSPSERSGAVTTTPLEVRTERGGVFAFPNVPPGEYVIQAYSGWRTASAEGEFASQFVMVDGSDLSGLVLHMSSGLTMAGHIRFEDADPPNLRDIELTASHADPDLAPLTGAPARASIHDDGTFEMSGVSGPRRLQVTATPAGWALKGIYLNGIDVTDTPQVSGRTVRNVRGLEVVFTARTTEVSGVVTDKAGAPVVHCAVTMFPVDRERWHSDSRFLAHTACRRDGAFAIPNLPPGEYLLAATAGTKSSQPGDEWNAPELLEALVPAAMRITLSEGQKLSVQPTAVDP